MRGSLSDDGTWIEQLPLPSVVLDDERRVVHANRGAQGLLGIHVGSVVSLPLRSSAEEGPRSDERYVLGSGGEPFLALVSWGPLTLAGRSLTLVQLEKLGALGLARVTEDRGRELSVHGVAIAELGIFEHDHLTQALWMSPQCRAIYGWSSDAVATLEAMMRCAHPDDGPTVGAAVMRAHDPSGDGLCDVEGRLFRPNGEVRWVRTRSRTFFEGEGASRRLSRTIGALVDLTEQKRRDATQRRLVAALEASPDLFAIADGAGNVEYLNGATRKALGIGATEAIEGRSLASLVPEAPRKLLVESAMPTAVAEGTWRGELPFVRADGATIDLSAMVMAHRDAAGAVDFFAAMARDVTEVHRLEQQLRQSQKMEAIGRLAGGIAHDFNNILSVILGYVDVDLDELEEGNVLRQDLLEVQRAARRAADLTQQMLAFSRKQVLRPRALDPADVLSGMETMIRRILGEDIELVCILGSPRARILADPSQLEQVILNLVVNARDAMPTGGKLLLETKRVDLDAAYVATHLDASRGPHVMLAVTDSGMGMDAATRERIFEPFFTTKGPGRGTGLGLATVYGIVRQSGGNLWVYSEPGRGTSFKVYFPVTEESAPLERDVPQPTLSRRGASILLVEDDEALRRLLTTLLTRAGYEVIAAEGPLEALAITAARDTLDLLLTDVVMPKMSGRQLADALAPRYPEMPVLYMSGYTENSVVHHGVLDEGISFLAKPVAPADLLLAVEKLLHRP